MGADVHLVGPRTLVRDELKAMGVTIHHDLESALKDADVVNVLRIQRERMKLSYFPSNREYARIWGINKNTLRMAKEDVLLLHPGPMNLGVEISPEVAYGTQSSIQEQVTNGISVRMAILYLTLMGGYDVEINR